MSLKKGVKQCDLISVIRLRVAVKWNVQTQRCFVRAVSQFWLQHYLMMQQPQWTPREKYWHSMLSFHTTSNKMLGRKPLSILRNLFWRKIILRERVYKFKTTLVQATRSMNYECFIIGKRITLKLLLRYGHAYNISLINNNIKQIQIFKKKFPIMQK